MNDQSKTILKYTIFSGLGFAGLMTAFDYYDGNDFNIWKFLSGFLIFGLTMGAMSRSSFKKQAEQEQNKDKPLQ